MLRSWQDWAEGLTDENVTQVASYHDLKGNAWATPWWRVSLHVVGQSPALTHQRTSLRVSTSNGTQAATAGLDRVLSRVRLARRQGAPVLSGLLFQDQRFRLDQTDAPDQANRSEQLQREPGDVQLVPHHPMPRRCLMRVMIVVPALAERQCTARMKLCCARDRLRSQNGACRRCAWRN